MGKKLYIGIGIGVALIGGLLCGNWSTNLFLV